MLDTIQVFDHCVTRIQPEALPILWRWSRRDGVCSGIVKGLGGDVRMLLTMLRASLTKDTSEAKSQNRNNENSTFNFNTLD